MTPNHKRHLDEQEAMRLLKGPKQTRVQQGVSNLDAIFEELGFKKPSLLTKGSKQFSRMSKNESPRYNASGATARVAKHSSTPPHLPAFVNYTFFLRHPGHRLNSPQKCPAARPDRKPVNARM